MKIWIKILKGDKIPSHTVVELTSKPTADDFIRALRDGAHALDVSTPTVLSSHVRHFNSFGVVRFYPDDFVEDVNFDKMEIELFKTRKNS